MVSNREDGRMLIFVDRYTVFGAFHARNVLNSAADATRNTQVWFHCLPRLANVRHPTRIDDSSSRTRRSTQGSGKFLHQSRESDGMTCYLSKSRATTSRWI